MCAKGTFTPFVDCDSQGECGSITSARYNLPGVQTVTPAVATTSGPDKQKWYSYNYGESLGHAPRYPLAMGVCVKANGSGLRRAHPLLGLLHGDALRHRLTTVPVRRLLLPAACM